MKKMALCLAMVGLLVVGGQAVAEICTIDAVPAATLLLPYFEVNLDDPQDMNTLFTVNNASAAPVVVHVVIWTDLSVPVLDFDIFLTGYDIVPVSMRDILVMGNLPVTDPNPASGISNVGDYSDAYAGQYPVCEAVMPYNNPMLTVGNLYLPHVQEALTGGSSPIWELVAGMPQCGGLTYGDRIARGYVTMDVVTDCNLLDPTVAAYYDPASTTKIAFDNVIWGDWFLIDPGENYAQGDNLVHIEAMEDYAFPDNYTFYGRYSVPPWGAPLDWREPLAQGWAARWIGEQTFSGGTDFFVWRDAKVAVNESIIWCGLTYEDLFIQPVGIYPLGQQAYIVFDEEENPFECETICIISPCLVPPECGYFVEARRYPVGGPGTPVDPTFDGGWIYNDFGHSVPQEIFGGRAGAWVQVEMSAEGRYTVGYAGIQLFSACADIPVAPPGN